MTLLYVFPHPDDESFGPGPAIASQVRQGHAVHLLTLTRGGATSIREDLGLSIEEMGAVREREMRDVAETLGLDLTVLDYPDGELAGLDPRVLEAEVEKAIDRVRPDVVVTYDTHGNSVHPDHLVAHAVVKRAFCAARERDGGPRRLALFALVEEAMTDDAPEHLRGTPLSEIGAVVAFTDADHRKAQAALDCYETYAPVIEEHQPLRQVTDGVGFVLFQESRDQPLDSLTVGLD